MEELLQRVLVELGVLRDGQGELRQEFRQGQEELRQEFRQGQEELRQELRQGQEELKRSHEELKHSHEELRRSHESVVSRLDHHYQILRALEDGVEVTRATTIALSEDMNYLRGKVAELEGKVDRLVEEACTKKDLEQTNERVARLETNMDWALLKIAQHDARLTSAGRA